MPNFNIHWKGYPHRRFPRIREASACATSVRSRNIPRIAALDSIPLDRQRKKQRFAVRRRRAQKSRSSSSAARARKHASLRAKQHIQLFGWDTDIASKANTTRVNSATSSIKASPCLQSSVAAIGPEDSVSQTTVINSNDGANCSAFRKPAQPENLYSLMRVAEVPVYWTVNIPKNRKKPPLAPSRALTQMKRPGEYAHPVSRRRSYRSHRPVGRSRTYDSRIDPRILLDRDRPTKSFPTSSATTPQRTASRQPPHKSWQGNPNLRRILSSKASKSKADPRSVTPSMKSVVQSLLSDPAPRTPSEQKALKRFTRELEHYLHAAKSLPKQTLAPSPSATTVSAHTVEEFRPYQAQLRSAGLAVTAADQLRKTSIMARPEIRSSPPPTPPKDEKYARKSVAAKSKWDSDEAGPCYHHKNGSIASFDTGTTVMDFTPPHEQTVPRGPRGRRRSSLSSDHTIMAFTPPHEKSPPQRTPPPLPTRASTKKSLPWLRKQEPVEASPSPSPKDKGIVTASRVKAKTWNSSDVLCSISQTKSPALEKTVDRPNIKMPRVIEPRKHDLRWQDSNSGIKAAPTNSLDKRKLFSDAAVQADLTLSDDHALADRGDQYADAIAQTNLTKVEFLSTGEEDRTGGHAPSSRTKNKTFSTNPKKCPSDCNQSTPQFSSVQSTRKRYNDQAAQTDLVERSSNAAKHAKIPIVSKGTSFKTNTLSPDPNCIFPFATTSSVQRSLVARSPRKSVDEVVVRRSRPQIQPAKTNPHATRDFSSSYPSPWPPRCTQCSAEIKSSNLEPQLESIVEQETTSRPDSEPEFVPDHQVEVEARPIVPAKWSHTCTARSSLECQQCAPLVVSGIPISEQEELSELPSHSQKRASRQSQACSTHWAATFKAELEEIIQGYQSPEERLTQYEANQETIDEHAKRPPLTDPAKKLTQPRLRTRSYMTSYPATKQERAKATRPKPAAPASLNNSPLALDSSGINDRAVFRGLQVATAAACNEDVAKWIEETTGTGIRRFLADLSAFDGLGSNMLAGIARKATKRGRGEGLAWERTDEEVLDAMVAAKGRRSREGLRERAIRMGWRDRSVSGGE